MKLYVVDFISYYNAGSLGVFDNVNDAEELASKYREETEISVKVAERNLNQIYTWQDLTVI